MKVTCLQMDTLLGRPEENLVQAEALIHRAMADKPDVLVLPEVWNTGFFPKENLAALSETGHIKARLAALAAKCNVNIVAGSLSELRDSKVYNTATVFDRAGNAVAAYDKIHLFTPLEENRSYTAGNRLCRFLLDGTPCGIAICYDIRFPELARTLAVQGLDMLFVVCQWPTRRIAHLRTLTTARAIENQAYVICCNSCANGFGGNSAIIDPWGQTLAQAGSDPQLVSAECDLSILQNIRTSINIFADRRPELYK